MKIKIYLDLRKVRKLYKKLKIRIKKCYENLGSN